MNETNQAQGNNTNFLTAGIYTLTQALPVIFGVVDQSLTITGNEGKEATGSKDRFLTSNRSPELGYRVILLIHHYSVEGF